jgi:hypothetical protein
MAASNHHHHNHHHHHHHHHSISSSKVCLCSPTNHPGSFKCRLHRNMPLPEHVVSTSSPSSLSLDHTTCSHRSWEMCQWLCICCKHS